MLNAYAEEPSITSPFVPVPDARLACEPSIDVSFVLTDLNGHKPVSGASIIEMGDPNDTSGSIDPNTGYLSGFSDSSGLVNLKIATPRLRILASGYTPLDLVFNPHSDAKTNLPQRHINLSALHQAAYSGNIYQKQRAIWAPQTPRISFLEFTSDGLMRKAGSLRDLMQTPYKAYSMVQPSSWSGIGAPTVEASNWCRLSSQDLCYPMSFSQDMDQEGLNEFRFPEPGMMLARNNRRPTNELSFTLLA